MKRMFCTALALALTLCSSASFAENYTPMNSPASDVQTEAAIVAAGLTAPRLSPDKIDAVIVGATYTVLPSGKVMICEITLINGFTVRGDASVVSRENFREDIGRKVSYEKARDQIWQLEGYLLQQRLFESTSKTA